MGAEPEDLTGVMVEETAFRTDFISESLESAWAVLEPSDLSTSTLSAVGADPWVDFGVSGLSVPSL